MLGVAGGGEHNYRVYDNINIDPVLVLIIKST